MWPNWDKDNSGKLSKEEAKGAITELLNNIEQGFGDMDEDQWCELFKGVDITEDGFVNKEEMAIYIDKKIIPLETETANA